MSIEDGFCSLMDPETCDLKDDLKMPEGDLGNQIKEALDKDEGSVLVSVTLFRRLRAHGAMMPG